MHDRQLEALERLGDGAALEPVRLGVRPRDDHDLVGRKRAQRVLDGLGGIGVADRRPCLRARSRLGRRRDLPGLRARRVLVAREPLEPRQLDRRDDDLRHGVVAGVGPDLPLELLRLERDRGDDEHACGHRYAPTSSPRFALMPSRSSVNESANFCTPSSSSVWVTSS